MELTPHLKEPEKKPASEPEAPEERPAEAEDPGALELGPGQERSDEELLEASAALLFASSEPLGEVRLWKLLERPERARVRSTLETLAARMEASPLPVCLRKIAGGWRLLTEAGQADVVARLRGDVRPEKITAASLETLAIVAYRQPVTKAEVEAIRGVQSGAMLRSLVDRGLARVTGRANQPGNPLQYGTTKDFLERFGLASLKDLPRDGELVEGS